MSAIDCGRCGGQTNTALCNWIDHAGEENPKADFCFARWENGEWVMGCYRTEEGDGFTERYARKLVEGSL